MARTSITGYQRQYGDNKSATPAVMLACIQFTFDSSQADTVGTGKFLPKGCIPVFAQNVTGGGTNLDNINIGVSGTASAFALDLDAENNSALVITGSALGTKLTANTEITAGQGSAAGTGDVTAAVYYIMADDGGA